MRIYRGVKRLNVHLHVVDKRLSGLHRAISARESLATVKNRAPAGKRYRNSGDNSEYFTVEFWRGLVSFEGQLTPNSFTFCQKIIMLRLVELLAWLSKGRCAYTLFNFCVFEKDLRFQFQFKMLYFTGSLVKNFYNEQWKHVSI